MLPLHSRHLSVALASVLAVTSCTRTADTPSGDGVVVRQQSAAAPKDERPVTASQLALLDLAFRVASSVPVEPHVKSRSRAQESVLVACHELGLHTKALELAPRIDNWRRGVAHADLAVHLAKSGSGADARHHASLALAIGEDLVKSPSGQEWRRDRIRAKVGCAMLLLGDATKSAEVTQGLAESELAELFATRAGACGDGDLAALESAIPRMVETGNLDVARAGMVAAAVLVDRFHDDSVRREQYLRFLGEQRAKVPAAVWFEIQLRLVTDALQRGDRGRALVLLDGAAGTLASNRWLDEDRIAGLGRMAVLRARCGDLAAARSGAAFAMREYDAHEAAIVDIWRAKALRPVAEALVSCGDLAEAAACYRRAVDVGTRNPNSRPRAEDLVATCLSMALCGYEPDNELMQRMEAVAGGLGAPW